MKLSVFREDDGFENYLKYRPVVVYVNGEILSNVVRLDTDEGWAEFSVIGEDGLFLIENSEIVTDITNGLVEVTGVGMPIDPEIMPPDPGVEPEPEPETLPEGDSNG